MKAARLWWFLPLLLCLQALAGCGAGSASNPSVKEVELKTLPETRPYRQEIAPAGAATRWIEPGAAGSTWHDSPEARKAVEAAITSAAARLASVDYASLSVPDFVTQTRSLKLVPALFTGKDPEVDAYAEGSAVDKAPAGWALYRWRGPELPQRPDRLQVYRWIHVYVLYSYDLKAVTRLLTTIYGEAIE
ncbi:MAG: hypothetical protein ACJ78Q_17550 [Chloroflexia bacterium]